jgi:hypothetical protein
MVDEVYHDFVVDDYVGQVDKDSIEAPAALSGLVSTNSLHESLTTGLCKPTKSSGDEPLFNRWIELIDECKAKNKGSVVLSEISRARVDTYFPIIYCTDPDKKVNNDKDWEPCVLKKITQELYEVLDANEDPFFLKEEVEYDSDDGLTSLWGSAFKYPTLAFISTYRKKVFTRNEKGNPEKFEEPVNNFEDADTSPEDADTSPSSKKDINGLRFAPSCNATCFIGDKRCAHKNWFNVELNHVEDYVAFPAVWWHHGICKIYSRNKIFYTVPKVNYKVPNGFLAPSGTSEVID